MIVGLKRLLPRLRNRPRNCPRNIPQKPRRTSHSINTVKDVDPTPKPDQTRKKTPARRRRRFGSPPGGPHYFGVKTRLERSTGKDNRYKLNAIRALPTAKKDTVVLQATDGQQAVCLLSPGRMSSVRLIPSEVLPVRNADKEVTVELKDDCWISSSGKTVEDNYPADTGFPPMLKVLPNFSAQPNSSHLRLGIDLALLNKVSMSLGTNKISLFIPIPRRSNGDSSTGEQYVNKPVAVCPATDEDGVRGIGVVMPLQPKNGTEYFMKVRQVVSDAEARSKPRGRPIKRGQ